MWAVVLTPEGRGRWIHTYLLAFCATEGLSVTVHSVLYSVCLLLYSFQENRLVR